MGDLEPLIRVIRGPEPLQPHRSVALQPTEERLECVRGVLLVRLQVQQEAELPRGLVQMLVTNVALQGNARHVVVVGFREI